MAEILIFNRPSTNGPDVYQRGDIVVVMPDGHGWGGAEGLPDFVRGRLSGDGLDVLRNEHTVPAGERLPNAVRASPRLWVSYIRMQMPERINRRRYHVDLDTLTIDDDGYVSLTLAQLEDKKHAA